MQNLARNAYQAVPGLTISTHKREIYVVAVVLCVAHPDCSRFTA